MAKKKSLILDIHDKPQFGQGVLLSFQHVFAMFGATILVPILTGYPISVALFASGLGTFIYAFITKFRVPIYLGSSFAYITAVNFAVNALGGDRSAAQTGLILIGAIYVIVAILIKFIGKDWIDKLLPPIVIGSMIMIIGLGLASSAISNAGLVLGGNPKEMIVALITFAAAAFFSTKAKGFFKIIPFLCSVVIGYICAMILGIVDYTPITEVISSGRWIGLPDFI
ncbi:MAG: uracil permease, partial [Erysipelotrichaceae bacterium]|nr:uracil permease [Erysipelotrichaceae bacterium]